VFLEGKGPDLCLEWLNWALFFSVPVPCFSALWGAKGELDFGVGLGLGTG